MLSIKDLVVGKCYSFTKENCPDMNIIYHKRNKLQKGTSQNGMSVTNGTGYLHHIQDAGNKYLIMATFLSGEPVDSQYIVTISNNDVTDQNAFIKRNSGFEKLNDAECMKVKESEKPPFNLSAAADSVAAPLESTRNNSLNAPEEPTSLFGNNNLSNIKNKPLPNIPEFLKRNESRFGKKKNNNSSKRSRNMRKRSTRRRR